VPAGIPLGFRRLFSKQNTINYHLQAHPFQEPPAMIVCVCHRVSDQTIARAARSGMAFDDIQLELGVATQCGKCESCARSVWSECRSGHPTAHLKIDELRQQLARGTLQLSPV
jgi:bacterioferritin-associated ferredoxin